MSYCSTSRCIMHCARHQVPQASDTFLSCMCLLVELIAQKLIQVTPPKVTNLSIAQRSICHSGAASVRH